MCGVICFKIKVDMISCSVASIFCFPEEGLMINKAFMRSIIDVIPGVKNINIDIEKLQKRFGVFGEPMLVGTVLGIIIAALAGNNVQTVLQIGVTLGAVMVLIDPTFFRAKTSL